ncbi:MULTISPECIES: hypothetical protein [unclassified Caulobacter]|uniref:hypothetical protein n=1 Tax=unclassified Caulobacter TaxID=2648921 RepID=UPI000D3A67EA|nr:MULTISPECIES: hypothetical protein [unclassified Caulobacter]PTS90320.1 hypothetical protein DBR21_04345 [Caulobacter sp. HMWF009]PTT11486.1 hypothetical protein DBR10_03425 [Caulobacter sp. HMWF025]
MSLVVVLSCGIFALAAVIGVLDLLVHLICKGARALRTPNALKPEGRDFPVDQPPAQGITA